MDFFKSVFSEPTPDPSPPSTPSTPTPTNPENTPPAASSWEFGSTLFRTIASKSESLIDNYYKDLQDFSTELKKETSVIRQAASRAVQDLPARLESGAAIAQESLEAVGQAIDNVGSTVSEIFGKDLNFAPNDGYSDSDDDAGVSPDLGGIAKPYSRLEAIIRGLQSNVTTYCEEVEEGDYSEWKLGFRVDERRDEIERLVKENGVIKEIYDEVVPEKVDEETFWCRYFYRVDKIVKAEEARARIVKRAISGDEEEELSWDVDDDDDEDGVDNSEGNLDLKPKDDLKKDNSQVEIVEDEGVGVLGTNSGVLVDDDNLGEGLICNEKEVSSEGKIGSDISIISSQRSSHAEDDLGWDEIEDIGSGDESKITERGSHKNTSSEIDLAKRPSGAEEDEDLSWDIEDDDEDVPVKL